MIDEHSLETNLDKIDMSDEKREAIKNNKVGFIKQTQQMLKLYNAVCNNCRVKIQTTDVKYMSSEEFKNMFCSKCKRKCGRYVK